MTTTTPSALVPAAPVFTSTERLALAGFLAGYSGLTREAYDLDLRQYASWCHQHHLRLFQARRADIECFARDLESRGRAGQPSPAGCPPTVWSPTTLAPSELTPRRRPVRRRARTRRS